MRNFKPGQIVSVPCEIRPGPFSGERLITVDSEQGALSGFVKTEFLTEQSNNRGYVLGKIVTVSPTAVSVRLPGSFFTIAAGIASVSPTWATSHLQHVSV